MIAKGSLADESTLLTPERQAQSTDVFSGIEDERLFSELRTRLFARGGPMRVGRYRVLRRLGAGAMGEVQLGMDDELERAVAIKFVHPHLASERWAEGLRREAKALARLAHPNVVHVHEVGTHDGRVYLVMEYIEGTSLREWLHAEKRTPQAILAAYLDAARGLAAAHGAGLVHRDFKPDNVLRGYDGRVAVADFGLAALEHDSEIEASAGPPGETLTSDQLALLSRPGEIKGTPAYMPPEQFLGRGDARSDQFALCVALYEGLYRRRPFPGRTLDEVRDGRGDWTPLPPPRRSGVPRWIWPILRRGLARSPDDRWPSVDALIEAIEAGVANRRRRARLLASGGVALAVGLASGLSVAYLGQDDGVGDCSALDVELAQTWDAARHEQLVARATEVATRTGRPWLEVSGARTADGLDRWRERWLDGRAALCRSRTGGDPVVDERHGACLERHRRTVAATVDRLLVGGPAALREGPRAIQSLPDPRSCADEARAGGPPEPARALAARVEAVRGELVLIEADLATARYEDALARAEIVLVEARELDYGPLLAEASLAHGQALFRSERVESAWEALERAADTGEASRHDRVVAQSWELLARSAATRRPDLERGRRWLRRAEASGARLGLDELAEARLQFVRGNLELLADDPEAALATLAPARAVFEDHGELVFASDAATAIARASLERGQFDEAEAEFERALELLEQVYGPQHPSVALAANNLGQLAFGLEQYELARAMLERAAAIWAKTGEARPRDAGRAHFILAQFELDAGEYEAALDHAQQAATSLAADLEPDDVLHSEVAVLVGTATYFLGRADDSVAAWRSAVAGYEAVHGPDDVYAALYRVGLGWALLAAGARDEARVAFATGRDAIEAKLGVGVDDSADAGLGLVAVALAEGSIDDARARLAAFAEPPSGEFDRLVHELFSGLCALRLDPTDPQAHAALKQAGEHARATAGAAAMFEVLLDSVGADASARRLVGL